MLIAPLITSLLIVAPLYPHEWFYIIMRGALTFTYAVALFVALPITLVLCAKDKCTLPMLAMTGFILGVSTLLILPMTTWKSYNEPEVSLAGIVDNLPWLIWYGFSAAIGASAFGLISGIVNWKSKKTATHS
jgi:hypothetical protein